MLNEKRKSARVHLLQTESFGQTFGKKSTRKKPRLGMSDLAEMAAMADSANDGYEESKDTDRAVDDADTFKNTAREYIFSAGQSKRIWNELYKVIDSSDVVIQVLDARDPVGTRSKQIENYLKKEKAHKHLILVLNKVDLIPTSVTKKWLGMFSKEYPTVAFKASLKNPYGKAELIDLLRQYSKLHSDSKQISVGFIGYPNSGKSSVINALRAKKVCNVAPIAGETKVWQYITLMKRIYLIDCPGVVYPTEETDEEKVLKGVVRVELVQDPAAYIPAVLDKVKVKFVEKTYKIDEWSSPADFLEKVAQKTGKLLKGGEPDVNTVSKMILNDFQRGKLPYFCPPPGCDLGEFDLKSIQDLADNGDTFEANQDNDDEVNDQAEDEESEGENNETSEEETEVKSPKKKKRKKNQTVNSASGKFTVK